MIKVFHNPHFLRDSFLGLITNIKSCVQVATVHTSDLSDAFMLTQNKENDFWIINDKVETSLKTECRSTSIGDYLEKDGIKYFVAVTGFKVISNYTVDYFKRHQRDNIYHYYKVVNGNGKIVEGFQEVINFLNPEPIISLEKNFVHDPSGLTGTWCCYEVGIPITKQEYDAMFKIATEKEFQIYV